MLKKTLIMAAVLLLAGCAIAESILSINLEVYRNDSVKVNHIRTEEGSPTKYVAPGGYRLLLEDEAGRTVTEMSMQPLFAVLSSPPVLMNSSVINLRIPYRENMKTLSLYRNDTRILSRPVDSCNRNGICDTAYESYLSCPTDCPLNKKDGMCIKKADKTCDPDCEEGADPDCTTGIQWFQTALYALAGFVVVAVLSIYFYHEMENRKVEKERIEFQKWKREHP